ncbi:MULTISPECIES: dienelactone hydrolase family protein [Subtercola]|uniref:Dienelactone hydrolase family protein n=1 Tax=Subtercola vilae TaxID=2056433 RepID=A0A4T2BYU5_9MICO|nr:MULTISPECIES: dienelactone hydrolase family protein [Subtercola]MEA9987157.1 dienelactone hydrolase family protein [Subtercola sp. RTI3]TIH36292.1 dienelactone hydrolase family protein [Subtercola vilae]
MTGSVELSAAEHPFTAYVATPDGDPAQWRGAIVVIHEVWGLVEHITTIADRYAAEGYLALAPDLMGGLGVTAEVAADLQRQLFAADPEERSAAQPRLRELMAPIAAPEFAAAAITKLIACVDYLEQQPGVDGRIGVTGFCFGGSYAFSLAVADARVKASAPFYGYANLTNELLAEIECPVLYFVGEDDLNLFGALPALTEQMHESGVDFEAVTYPGAGHAFFNDTNAHAYRPDSAHDSWQRSTEFFARHLVTSA